MASRYKRDALSFRKGNHLKFEILRIAASDGIAYWVGFKRGKARMSGKEEEIPMNLRVTELFHREGGDWKIVHQHADPLA